MSLFSRVPKWLYEALGYDEPDVPNRLRSNSIDGVLDVGQGGWAFHSWTSPASWNQPASTAAGQFELAPVIDDVGHLIVCSVFHLAGAAATDINFAWRDPVTANEIVATVRSIAPSVAEGNAQLFGVATPLIVMPGFSFVANAPATGVGEQWFGAFILTPFRKGFKPL